MSSDLFRPEVYKKDNKSYGNILLVRPISFFAYTCAISVIVVAIILYSYFGHYRNYESLQGVVISSKGVIDISTIKPGVIWKIEIEEGQNVKKGDPLLLIKTETKLPTGRVENIISQQIMQEKALIDSQISELNNIYDIQLSMIEKKIENSKSELFFLKKKNNIHQAKYRLISEDVAIYEKSLKKGQITTSQYRDKLYQKQQVEIEMLQDNIEKEKILAAIVEDGKKIQKSKAELNNEINIYLQKHAELKRLHVKNDSDSEYLIESPVDGKVSVLLGKMGQHINTSDLLLTILPSNSQLQAEFYAPSRSVGFSSTNQEVLIRYDAFPYQKYGLYHGRVVSISETILQPEHASNSMKINESVYKILVKLDHEYVEIDDKIFHLQPGMALSGRFLGQNMKLIEWVFEPLINK